MPTQDQIDDATTLTDRAALIDFSKLGVPEGPTVTIETDASGIPFVKVPLSDGTFAETSVEAFGALLEAQVSPNWRIRADVHDQSLGTIHSRLMSNAPDAGGLIVRVPRLIAGPLKLFERITYADGNPRNLRPENLLIHSGGTSETLMDRRARQKVH